MWLEAILSRHDLDLLAQELCPLHVRLGAEGDVLFSAPHDVELVAGVGLRAKTSVEIHWPAFGLFVPLLLPSAVVLARPEVGDGAPQRAGRSLAVRLEVEQVEVELDPGRVPPSFFDRLNEALSQRREAVWDFGHALARVFELPESLASVRALDFEVAWGEIRVSSEAAVLAVSLRTAVLPRGMFPREDRGEKEGRGALKH